MAITIPVGTIMMYAGDSGSSSILNLAENGWLLCDGSKYSRTKSQYAPLFSTIGEAFGGSTDSFNVPLCSGLFLRGVSGESSRDPDADERTASRPDLSNAGNSGNAIGSLQTCQLQSHSHSYDEYSSSRKQDSVSAHHSVKGGADSVKMDSSGGAETRPKNIYVNFIIKFTQNDANIPVGGVIPFAGDVPNEELNGTGWLLCDGTGLDQGTYPDLFSVIESYSGGDDNTFYLPDYRGRFLRGVQGTPPAGVPIHDPESALRKAPTDYPKPGNHGNLVGSLQADAFQSHQHSYDYNDSSRSTAATAVGFNAVAHDDGNDSHSSGSYGGSETRPLNINVHYLIKATDAA